MTPATVLDALDAELQALQIVQDTLEREHTTLVNGPAEAVESAIEEKTAALNGFADKRAAREALSTTTGLKQHIEGRRDLSDEQRRRATALVEALHTCGGECHELNQRNGRLIRGLRDRTESTLGILRSGETSVTLYGQTGDRSSDLGSRVLGTA